MRICVFVLSGLLAACGAEDDALDGPDARSTSGTGDPRDVDCVDYQSTITHANGDRDTVVRSVALVDVGDPASLPRFTVYQCDREPSLVTGACPGASCEGDLGPQTGDCYISQAGAIVDGLLYLECGVRVTRQLAAGGTTQSGYRWGSVRVDLDD